MVRRFLRGLLLACLTSTLAYAGDNVINFSTNSSDVDALVRQKGTSNQFKVTESITSSKLKIHGYSKSDEFLTQNGNRNKLLIKSLKAKDEIEIGITQDGSDNVIDLSSSNVQSTNGSIKFKVFQSGNGNEFKVNSGISAYDDVTVDVSEEGGNNKINVDSITSLSYLNFKVSVYNTGNEENLIGGVEKKGTIAGLDDLIDNRKLAFSYDKGLQLSGNGVKFEAEIYGTGNKLGVYQVSDSGEAVAKVLIGDRQAYDSANHNTVVVYQHATGGKDAYADISVFGSDRTVRVYQEGEARATILVKKTYNSTAPIRVYQKTYDPSGNNEVKVTFE